MEVITEGKKTKLIDIQVRDENRFSSTFQPSYEGMLKIKVGGTYIGLENIPLGLTYAAGESERAAMLIALRLMQEGVEFLSHLLATTKPGEKPNV